MSFKTIGSNSGKLSASVLLANLKVFGRILNKEEIRALFLKQAPFLIDKLSKNRVLEQRCCKQRHLWFYSASPIIITK